jgi:hypothetical protein
MENDGTGNFTDIINGSGINPNDLGAWENQAADFDNDGFVDIFSEMSNELYMNNGDMTFTGMNLSFDEGAIGDFNNDGFLDVVNDGNFYRNDGNANNYVKFALEGVVSNYSAIGARVQINGDWGIQIREVRSGQGFSHMNSLIAHFGIGTSTTIDSVVITWPSGIVDQYVNVDINTQHVYIEGDSVLATTDFQKDGISIFPNPTSEVINFSLAGLENTPAIVMDMNGKIVLNTRISIENNINVANLNSGVYFVQIEVEKQTVSHKFIKN